MPGRHVQDARYNDAIMVLKRSDTRPAHIQSDRIPTEGCVSSRTADSFLATGVAAFGKRGFRRISLWGLEIRQLSTFLTPYDERGSA
jgi:hypothetical protein